MLVERLVTRDDIDWLTNLLKRKSNPSPEEVFERESLRIYADVEGNELPICYLEGATSLPKNQRN